MRMQFLKTTIPLLIALCVISACSKKESDVKYIRSTEQRYIINTATGYKLQVEESESLMPFI